MRAFKFLKDCVLFLVLTCAVWYVFGAIADLLRVQQLADTSPGSVATIVLLALKVVLTSLLFFRYLGPRTEKLIHNSSKHLGRQ